jgi:hypothetical protein
MRRHLLAALASATALACAAPAYAQVVDQDPLHSVVCNSLGGGCVNTDNGSFAPITGDVNWGFEISPGPATGNLSLVILVPTNTINVATFNLPGLTDNGGGLLASSVVSRTNLFNAGDGASLAAYAGLGTGYSPTDNFSNASAGEAANDPGFNGNFLAFVVDVMGLTFNAQGSLLDGNNFSFGANLPNGTVITAFAQLSTDHTGAPCTNNCLIGTAASEDLVVVNQLAAVPGPIVGAGLPGLLSACVGLWAFQRRRRARSA